MNEKDIHIIERYLDGQLSPEERAEVERRLEQDDAFKQLFQERQALKRWWQEAEEYRQVKETVGEVMREEKTKQRFLKRRRVFYAAASVVLLLGILLFAYQKKRDSFIAKNELAVTDAKQTSGLKKDIPKHYASVAYAGSLTLVEPKGTVFKKENGTLEFRWRTERKGVDTLFVKEVKTGENVLKEPVNLEAGKWLGSFSGKQGKYVWYLGSTSDTLSFEIK